MDPLLTPPTPPTPPYSEREDGFTSTMSRRSSLSSGSSKNSQGNRVQPTRERPPSKRQFVWGHCKSLALALLRFIFKNNNLALIINLVHHLWSARTLLVKSLESKRAREALGAMHLAFAMLSSLALRERRRSTDRSALFVLMLVAMGQALTHVTTYWRKKTVRTLRATGLLDGMVFAVSSMAFSKAVGHRRR